MPAVIIGRDAETRQEISIGDIERRSGLYLLGRPGAGKTTLIKNIIAQDIANGHGVFFLDPHGDAIEDLQKRIPADRKDDVIVLDPADELYSFGINLLACPDPHNMTQLTRTFAPAIEVFKKLFANVQTEELDILLNQYLRNSFFPLIANQGYTLAEIPLFLSDKQFRDRLLQNPSIRPQVVRFWRDVFDRLPQDDQRKEIASTLRRLDFFEDYDQIRHIIGQSASTLHFSDIMDKGKILFVKLSATLPPDVKRIIGTILISNLVHAVLLREHMPEDKRRHFCIFVDEFQNFASSDDFAVLFTQARKYAIATTIAHQERYGQFADNKRISGATDAAVNKIFFQVSVRDAREQAAEFAKEPTTTETRLEAELVITQHPFWDLLRRGHTNSQIKIYVNKYFRPLYDEMDRQQMELERIGLGRQLLQDKANLLRDDVQLLQVDERTARLNSSTDRFTNIRTNSIALANTEAAVGRVISAHRLSEAEGLKLKILFEEYKENHVRINNIDRFLTGIMENHILLIPEQEQYAQFFINVFGHGYVRTLHVKVLWLYLCLEYGDPGVPRSIPAFVAMKYCPHQLEDAYAQNRRKELIEHYQRIGEAKKKELIEHYQRIGKSIGEANNDDFFILKVKNLEEEHRNRIEEYLYRDMQHYRKTGITFEHDLPAKRERGYIPLGEKRETVGALAALPDVPARILIGSEIKAIKDLCYNELLAGINTGHNNKAIFQIIEELNDLCQLLSMPENHIKVPSGQYVEKHVHVRTVNDMNDEMVQELINLRPHTAYVKSVWKGKIQTIELDQVQGAHLVDVGRIARKNAIDQGILKPRSDIEQEIRERQERWRRRGGNEPPPPTHTGGNTPPSLPSGHTGSNREPPPTHYIPEKAPEEKPPGNSAFTQLRTGTDDSVEARVRQTGKIIEFSSYRQQHRENEIVTPIESPSPTPYESIPAPLSPAPVLQTRQTPALREEQYAALRERLIPIVKEIMVRFEKAGNIDIAARCALALHDKEAANRLQPKTMQTADPYKASIGRLALFIGDEATANSIIQFLETKRDDPYWSIYAAALIAADLPDKTTVKKLIRELENQGRVSMAAEIAVKIGDKKTIARIMHEADKNELDYISDYTTLPLLAPFHPELAMKLVKRHESYKYHQYQVGITAAILGDRETAWRAMAYLKDIGGDAIGIASNIAAILGDTSTAEALMWEYRKQDQKGFEGRYLGQIKEAAQHNPEAVCHLLQALEHQGCYFGWQALPLLESLESILS